MRQIESRWWHDLIPAEDRAAYRRLGHRSTRREGTPCLIVIDMVRAFLGRPGRSLEESAAEWPTSAGPAAWATVPTVNGLLKRFDSNGWPTVVTRYPDHSSERYGGTLKGAGPSPADRPGGQEIVPELAPLDCALILEKTKASAFFETPLASHLRSRDVGSVVVVGGTTSGCVRASVVDAHSHGYPVVVIEDGCFDRSRFSHGVNLFEIDAKYADVLTAEFFHEEWS